jgi:hypothetical protein
VSGLATPIGAVEGALSTYFRECRVATEEVKEFSNSGMASRASSARGKPVHDVERESERARERERERVRRTTY